MGDLTAGAGTEPATVFDVLLPSLAKPYLNYVMLCCMCLGMLIIDFFHHVSFDISLLRKPGWTEPAALISRLTYFLVRYIALVDVVLMICMATLQFDNCTALPRFFGVISVFMLDGILLILLQRTVALYAWKRKVVAPLGILFLVVVVFSLITGIGYVTGSRIEGTNYCSADTRRDLKWTMIRSGLYRGLSMLLDAAMFFLTLNRLIDGGIRAIRHKKPSELYSSVGDTSLSAFLIRQGLHFYATTFAVDVLYIVTFFGLSNPVYQGIANPIAASVTPIVAAAAFRDMGRKATAIGHKNARKVNDVSSDAESNLPTGNPSRYPASSTSHQSHAMSPLSNAAEVEKQTRVTWNLKQSNHFNRSRREPLDLENGVLVTVGTVSRVDRVEQEWEQRSPHSSSEDLDRHTIETDHKDSVAAPAIETTATTQDDAYPPRPLGNNAETWIPRTPEAEYPGTLLSPSTFARGAATAEAPSGYTPSRPSVHGTGAERPDDAPWRSI